MILNRHRLRAVPGVLLLALSSLISSAAVVCADQNDGYGWYVNLAAFGAGFGDRSNVGHGNPSPGPYLSYEFCTLARSLNLIGDLGVGTTVFEGRLFNTNAPEQSEIGNAAKFTPASFFPLVAMYPLEISGKNGYVFAGGSPWGLNFRYVNAGVVFELLTEDSGSQDVHTYLRLKLGGYLPSDSHPRGGSAVDGTWMLYVAFEVGAGTEVFQIW